MSDTTGDILLEARAITKRYPGTTALDGVTYRVYRNQVNVLIGENGAGKSTLMRILAGAESADEGNLILDGNPIEVRSPRQAAAQGISIVHQELSILPNLNLAENVFAGRELLSSGILLDRRAEEERCDALLHRLRKPMPVRTQAAHLPIGHRQMVEIARALDQKAKVLILDEPTSALSTAETDSLFQIIEDLKQSGVTIIYISHRLHELLHLGDYFVVLRSGRIAGQARRPEVSREWIVERMSGRAAAEVPTSAPAISRSSALLRVTNLELAPSAQDEAAQSPLHGISLTVNQGEVVGIYGLLGAGRTELLECIAGVRQSAAGLVRLRDKQLNIKSVTDAVKAGIILVPEDRQRDGLFPELSVRENIALASLHGVLIHRTTQSERVQQLITELHIAAPDPELPVAALSGGNQQKVLIARCLMCSPSVLLLDEPTRGVDVNAKQEIYAILRRLAERGLGILFTSSEIEETRTLADRVLVLCQGHISAELSRSELTEEALFAAASPVVSPSVSSYAGVVQA